MKQFNFKILIFCISLFSIAGITPLHAQDSDSDGFADSVDLDSDNDGILDDEEGRATNRDTDGDGVPDYLDLDSDNDGVFDSLEANPSLTPIDIDTNGRLTGGVDSDGVPNTANGGFTPVNTNGNSTPNYIDLDSDSDGCSDTNEYYKNGNKDGNADGTDNAEFGTGTPSVDGDGLVIAAGYTSTGQGLADGLDDTITDGCLFVQTANGNWNTPSNWREDAVPTFNNDARIASGVISNVSSNQSVKNLITDQVSTVDITVDFTINVKEDLTNNGNIAGDGYIVFDAVGIAQNIYGDGANAGSFYNLRVDNPSGVTLRNNTDIYGILNLKDGDFTVENGSFLTFKSIASTTAILNEVNSGLDITGCVVVERYIPAKRAFRYLASPVNTDTAGCGVKPSINENLQEGQTVTDFNDYDTTPANLEFGTHITGSASGQNGFDATQTGNPSIFTYDEPTQDFEAIPNTNVETLTVGMPFAILIRGGRDMDLNQSNFEVGDETTLRFTGELLTGPQSATGLSTASGGFSFIANPYQAQIDLGELLLNDATDIQSTKVWIYDPRQAGAFGKYVLVEYDASGNYDTATPSSAFNGFLQPNQSFFVQNVTTATPSPSLTFREPQKIDATQTTAVFNTNPDTDLTVAMDLYASDEDDLRDGIIVRIADNYSDAVNDEDGVKFWNFLESMATFQNGEYLTSDRRHLDENDELVQLYISNYGESNYNFKIDVNNPDNEEVYLIDNYLDTETQLVASYQEHSFSVDASVPSSIDPNRFQLNFEQSTLGNDAFETSGISIYPNPVKDVLTINLSQFTGEVNSLSLYDITGKLVNHQNMTNANTEQEINLENYTRGIYILHIDTKNSQYQHKLIKK